MSSEQLRKDWSYILGSIEWFLNNALGKEWDYPQVISQVLNFRISLGHHFAVSLLTQMGLLAIRL